MDDYFFGDYFTYPGSYTASPSPIFGSGFGLGMSWDTTNTWGQGTAGWGYSGSLFSNSYAYNSFETNTGGFSTGISTYNWGALQTTSALAWDSTNIYYAGTYGGGLSSISLASSWDSVGSDTWATALGNGQYQLGGNMNIGQAQYLAWNLDAAWATGTGVPQYVDFGGGW